MAKDHITLSIPAKAEYAKTVRMTAARLAARIGMSYDDVADVILATEEAFVFACDLTHGTADAEVHFHVNDQGIDIEVRVPIATGTDFSLEEGDDRRIIAEMVLQSVCDAYELTSDETGTRIYLSKRADSARTDADEA